MISDQEKIAVLNQILSSKSFAKTTTASVLLKFLVESSIKGDEISAAEIGHEIFGSQYDHEKSEINARVNIYHLRKKLDKYYTEEGVKDSVKITIQKGQYGVVFKKQEQANPKRIIKNIAFAAVALITLIATLLYIDIKKKQVEVPFWDTFFDDNENTAVLVGDLFSFSGPILDGSTHLIRRFQVNNETELEEFIEENPEYDGRFERTDFRILNQNVPYATYSIGRFFERYSHELEIFINSNTGINLIKSKPTIFFGNPKTLYDMAPIIETSNTSNIKLENRRIFYTDPETGKSKSFFGNFNETNAIETDYTFVSYFKKPGGKDAFVFVSEHDIGIISAIDYFTNIDSLKSFEKKLPQHSKYFTAICKSSGMARSDLSFEIIKVDIIKTPY